MSTNTIIYDDENKLEGWDFESNLNIDIFNTNSNSEIEANWICEKCKKSFKEKINTHTKDICSNCKKHTSYLKTLKQLKTSYYLDISKNLLFQIIISIILSIICNSIVFIKEDLNNPDVIFNLIISLTFDICLILSIMKLIISIFNKSIHKNSNLVRQRITLYNLFNNIKDVSITKSLFYKTIENRLLSISKYDSKKFNRLDILYMFTSEKKRKYIKNWVIKDNRNEFKQLLKIYKNTNYFDYIYSSYETKDLIQFTSKESYNSIITSFVISIISICFTILPNIQNKILFHHKIFALSLLLIISIVLTIVYCYIIKQSYEKKLFFNTCYISSAIAKELTHNNKTTL